MAGTKFRTMLAPIGLSTGDGRRFQDGGISLAPAPFAFEWAREREGGHDGAVSVGAVQETAILTVADALADGWIGEDRVKGMDRKMTAVWARGVMFDDASREDMPRLAEDVAEALHLISNGTLGPSVDLDSFDAVPVFEGTDEPVTYEKLEAYYEEHGEEPKLELLITEGRVRAATLVSIPAFQETSRPLELLEAEPAEGEGAAASETSDLASLVASVSGGRDLPELAAFTLPELAGPTPITWDFRTGRVFGHIATWRTCHVGYSDVCVTAPRAGQGGYSWFNRYPVETSDGETVWAGRLTVGGQHAGLTLSANGAMSAHDSKTVAADVIAYEDEHGIVLAGAIRPGLDAGTLAILERRRVSGDWREISGSLALVEVLALSPGPRATSEPGFPVSAHSRAGRQAALVASFGPEDIPAQAEPSAALDALADRLLDRAEERRQAALAAAQAREELTATLAAETDGARAELAALVGEG